MKGTEMDLMQPQEARQVQEHHNVASQGQQHMFSDAPSTVQISSPALVGTLFEGLPSPSAVKNEATTSFQQRMMVEVPLINGEPPASLAQGWTQMRNCCNAESPVVSEICFPHLPEVSGCIHHSYQTTSPPPMTPQEEAAQRRREKNKFRMRALRASETEVARRLRERNKLRMRRLRASQSQVAQRLKERNAFRMRNIRAAGGEKLKESNAIKLRLEQTRDDMQQEEEKQTRGEIVQLPLQGPGNEVTTVPLFREDFRWTCLCNQLYRPTRLSQTNEEVERRRERGRLRMRMLRSSETEEQAARRRELNRLRMRQKRNSQKVDAQGT